MARRETTNSRPAPPKWTAEEDNTLLEEIGKNPLNLKMCFISTATLIRRSPSACAGRWYGTLSKSNKRLHTGILTIGRHQAVRNRKRFKEGMDTITLRGSLFYRILTMLGIRDNE